MKTWSVCDTHFLIIFFSWQHPCLQFGRSVPTYWNQFGDIHTAHFNLEKLPGDQTAALSQSIPSCLLKPCGKTLACLCFDLLCVQMGFPSEPLMWSAVSAPVCSMKLPSHEASEPDSALTLSQGIFVPPKLQRRGRSTNWQMCSQ